MQERYRDRDGRRSWTVVQAHLAYQGEEAPETPAGAAATTKCEKEEGECRRTRGQVFALLSLRHVTALFNLQFRV